MINRIWYDYWLAVILMASALPLISFIISEKYQIKGNTVGLAKLPRWFLILCDYVLMSPVLFKHLEQRGISTYLWVLNSQEEYSRALDLGATGIMTDYPSKLKAFVDQNCKIDWVAFIVSL